LVTFDINVKRTMQDQLLITKLRAGDPKGFQKLYAYFPVIQKWLVANGCEKNQSQDVFQQALLVLCEKCQDPKFELTASIETYLFSVSKFVWYNYSRKNSRKNLPLRQVPTELLELTASNDLDALYEKETKLDYAFKALEQISERCRTILQLFYLKKKTMAEIAKQFSFKSEKIAKNQKYKCLQFAKQKALQLISK
jgi:RNA polymerase sigma factor (sigma-70 family)